MESLNWKYKGEYFTDENIGEHTGFVYVITNKKTNKKYIGKKTFFFLKTKVTKGKKKRQKTPSDWKTYYGSNTSLQEDVKMNGVEFFEREILHLCKTKGQCNYLEAKEQFKLCVLESENYYNDWIMVKVRKSHLGNLNE
jgi:hypothetical protein